MLDITEMFTENREFMNKTSCRYLHKSTLAAAIGLGMAVGCSQSLAVELEEIIVTAQKRSESANDVGMAIQAVSGDMLAEQGITDTADLASLVPGFTSSEGVNGTPIYTLRGVGFNDSSVQAAATVGIYVDEVAIPYPVMTSGAILDMARVEVLKGPQGTLYGRNSTGGAINYIANKPGDEYEASVTAGYARFEEVSISGFVSAPLSDTAGLRIAGKTTQSGKGWQESLTTGERLGEKDHTALRAILDLNPVDALQVTLAANWWQDQSEPQALASFDFEFIDPSNTPVADAIAANTTLASGKDNTEADWTQNNSLYRFKNDLSYTSVSAVVKWDISDSVQLTSLTSYSTFKDKNSLRSNDGMAGVPTVATGNPPFLSLVPGSNGNQANYNNANVSDIEAMSQELRFSGETETFNWIAGIYLAKDEIIGDRIGRFDFTTNTDFAPGIQFDNLENRANIDGELFAVFTHGEWQLSDNAQLTAGLRYTEDKKDFEGCTADPGTGDLGAFFGALPGGCISANDVDGSFELGFANFELEEDSVSGRLGLDYALSNDHLLYATYSRGFKAGSFPTVDSIFHSQLGPVEQERVDAFEVGLKSTLVDGAMQFNAGAFLYDYKDKQLSGSVVTAFGVLPTLVNAPESEVTGIEFDLQWQLTESWYANISATHIKSEIREFTGIDTLGNNRDFSGDEFPNSPDTAASATINYETDISKALRAGFGLNVAYQSEMKSAFSDDQRFTIDSYALLNARAFVASSDDQWRANLWVRNLTDEFYLFNVLNGIDTVVGYTGMPRSFGVDFTYNWN
jgi:outer membrane receptor protein involved in Fe transport